MKFRREDMDKVKGENRDTTGIRVDVKAPGFSMVLITEG